MSSVPSSSSSYAPMKHRLRNRTPAELYEASCGQRCHRKYVTHCTKFGIPYPNVGEREAEHLDECYPCQQTWPLFLYDQHYVRNIALEEVSRSWCNTTEANRKCLYELLVKADRQWLTAMLKRSTASSFQLFTKDALVAHPDLQQIKRVQERSGRLAALWAAQSDVIKRGYEVRAQQLKDEHRQRLANLPGFKKKQLERARRCIRRAQRDSHPPKPPNPYILYQQEQWLQEQKRPDPLPYKDFVYAASQRWKEVLTPEDKQPFVDRAKELRERYFLRRNAAVHRMKQLKQSQRNARRVLLLRTRNFSRSWGSDDDEGDNRTAKRRRSDHPPPPPVAPDDSDPSEDDDDDDDDEGGV